MRAKRIVEDDGGYLDLFRSSDGRVLWASRGYDDGTSKDWEFVLQTDRSGWGDAVLQFVDNVSERRDHPSTTTWDEEMGESETGPYRLLAEAWLVSAQARTALRPPSGRRYRSSTPAVDPAIRVVCSGWSSSSGVRK